LGEGGAMQSLQEIEHFAKLVISVGFVTIAAVIIDYIVEKKMKK
jgi:hypothetical protein